MLQGGEEQLAKYFKCSSEIQRPGLFLSDCTTFRDILSDCTICSDFLSECTTCCDFLSDCITCRDLLSDCTNGWDSSPVRS